MLFNSLEFFAFFVIVYALYLILKQKWQNRMLLAASYIFYGAWDWRFLSLIFISTVLDYFCGLKISNLKTAPAKKVFLSISIFGNLFILGFFKYYNFFTSSLEILLSRAGLSIQPHFFNIILPIGISFYTFQTMSYTIDIYRGKLEPTRKFLDFALFVAFFPQLVAGPIERAKNLLPQILGERKLTLDKFYTGCYLIFWGLFLKMFIADNLALIVNPIFANKSTYYGAEVLIGLYAFSFQIFCDFAGYSNIARGLGKLMGFDIMINFNLPYFATNPREFWQRWHISLSSWLKDYLYIPLGGNRKGALKTFRNLSLTMLLGGLWHGANWTFIIWGAYHGLLLGLHRVLGPLFGKIKLKRKSFIQKVWLPVKIIIFFNIISLGWLLFRAESISQAYKMLTAIIFNFNSPPGVNLFKYAQAITFFTFILILVQIFQYRKNDLLIILKTNIFFRALFYLVCFYLMLIFAEKSANEFIYFQF